MLKIYQSNETTLLIDKACKILYHNKQNNKIENDTFIVENHQFIEWIKYYIANKLGIVANINFIKLDKFILNMFNFMNMKTFYEYDYFSYNITWEIMKIYEKKNISHFTKIKDKTLKKFQFSIYMTKLFKKYSLYRLNWIKEYKKTKNTNLIKKQKWQILLWKNCLKNIKKKKYKIISNFYEILNILSKKIRNNNYNINNIPKNIFIFQDVKINIWKLQILNIIGKIHNIYIFINIPSRNFYINFIHKKEKEKIKKNIQIHLNYKKILKKTFNPLLSFLGKIGFEYSLLRLNIKSKYLKSFSNKSPKNILEHLQNQLNDFNFNHSVKKTNITEKDQSISIHICNTIYNEIEILYKNIIKIINNHHDIMLHDIIVATNNINIYSPFIKTIFKSPNKKYKIPYIICNEINKKMNIALNILKYLFELPNNEFKNEEIFYILEHQDISKKFLINEKEIKILKKWTQKTNIKWGFNIQDKINHASVNINTNTWNFGINQILIGCALQYNTIWNNIIPYNDPEGSLTNLVNKLIIFIFTLFKWKKKLSRPKKLKSWLPIFNKLIQTFLHRNIKFKKELKIIHNTWKKIISSGIKSQYNKNININILYDELFKNKKYHTIQKNIKIGKLAFCTIKSIYTIPFKVIYILGSNDTYNTKKKYQEHLDLLKLNKKIGDPSYENENRYSFLNIINSAKKYLYISYNLDPKNAIYNQKKNSIIVDELLNYIKNNFQILKNKNTNNILSKIVYYHKNNNVYNKEKYNKYFKNISFPKKTFFFKKKIQKIKSINLKKFLLFWKNPIHYFFYQHLKIKFNIYKSLENDKNTEPFLLNRLYKYQINYDIIQNKLNKKNDNKIFKQYKAKGILPHESFDKIFWENQKEQVHNLSKKLLKTYKNNKIKTFNITTKNYHLNGNLLIINKKKIIRWKANKLYFSDLIVLWLEHLIYCILGGKENSKILGLPNIEWKFHPINKKLAYIYLNDYIIGYLKGLINPIPLIKSGIAWMQSIYNIKNKNISNDIKTQNQANKKMFNIWIGNKNIDGEKNDIYVKKIIPILNKNYINIIQKTAKKWMLPILHEKKTNIF